MFNTHHGILGAKSNSMGAYLRDLTTHTTAGLGTLPKSRAGDFQKNIVNERNRHMHQPGQYPQTHQEILALLGEMDACLSEVLAL
jgi:hypothetical protein